MGMFSSPQKKLAQRLHKAIDNTNLEKLKTCLAEGASPNLTPYSSYGSAPLHSASWNNFTEGVKCLLASGAVPNTPEENCSALHYAAERDNLAIVTALLDAGADVNMKRYDGYTPLHLAAMRGKSNIIRALIAKGADVNATDQHMNTPADLAEKEYPRVADMIRGLVPAEQKLLEPAAEEEHDDWSLTGAEEIACVSVKATIGYRLTEIFNFRAGIYTRIAHNLASGAESQSVRFFDEFTNRVAIDDAQRTFVALGGDSAALKAEKPALKPQDFPKM